MTQYKVNVGINYPPEKRAEPGDVVDDIPEKSLPWLLEEGIVEPVASENPLEQKASKKGGDK